LTFEGVDIIQSLSSKPETETKTEAMLVKVTQAHNLVVVFLSISVLVASVVQAQDPACFSATSQRACESKTDSDSQSCVWCLSRAVSNGCFATAEAASLPGSVFHCLTSDSLVSDDGSDEHSDLVSADYGSQLRGAGVEESLVEKESMHFHDKDEPHETKMKTSSYSFLDDGIQHVLEHKKHEGSDADLCDGSSASISGYMSLTGSDFDKKNDKHLFFWMFEKRPSEEEVADDDDDEVIPFVVWLTGGPGCSSTLALLSENGPCSVNEDGTSTTVNPYSWTEKAHVLWLDQPAGVGFSYGTENDKNEEMVGEDAYYFLQAFFKTYPEYAASVPFLNIVGESYGGHYAPAIAHRVWVGNQEVAQKQGDIITDDAESDQDELIVLPLAGLAIGNGLTDPEEQYKWYPEMMYNNSHGIQVVGEAEYEMIKQMVPRCTSLIHKCNSGDNFISNFACQTAFVVCNSALTSPYQMTGLNPYDIRIKCEVPPLCYDFSKVENWLNLPSTKSALGVAENHAHSWTSCNFGINMKFRVDWMKTFGDSVSDLVNDGVRTLIYAGDVDFICNYLGNQAWTLKMSWDYQSEFQAAEPHDWNNGGGLARSAHGLTFLQVYDAGHMVPSDQPEVAMDMIGDFVSGKEF